MLYKRCGQVGGDSKLGPISVHMLSLQTRPYWFMCVRWKTWYSLDMRLHNTTCTSMQLVCTYYMYMCEDTELSWQQPQHACNTKVTGTRYIIMAWTAHVQNVHVTTTRVPTHHEHWCLISHHQFHKDKLVGPFIWCVWACGYSSLSHKR